MVRPYGNIAWSGAYRKMKKNILLKSARGIEKRFFFSSHQKEQVNKIVYEYFYVEQKIYKVIDQADIRNLLQVDKKNVKGENSREGRGGVVGSCLIGGKEKLYVDHPVDKQLKDIIRNEVFCEKLKNIVDKYICNYITNSKYFIHLCIFYIYNNEKKKFFELMKKFNMFCFSYEDLFILFYLLCRINYKDMHIIRSILHVFEIYYYKIDNTFSYSISNLLFHPHDNLHTAINSLPLFYKIKLINIDKCYYEKGHTLQRHGDAPFLEDASLRGSSNQDGEDKNAHRGEHSEGSGEGRSDKGDSLGYAAKHEEVEERLHLQRIDESQPENILENMQDVDMEKYEKEISKDGIKFINLNIKKEKQKMKGREIKYEGLKLKSTLLSQIKNYVEKKEIRSFEIKEILTIFIHDNELANKNNYVKDFINALLKYFITHKGIMHSNILTLLIFMKNVNYYYDKRVNIAIEHLLMGYIGSMYSLSEKGIYNFINEKVTHLVNPSQIEKDKIQIGKKSQDILDFLYNQQYTYNFALYNENDFSENKHEYVSHRILKNYFFLISYMLRLPFLKFNIMKSYLNSFNIFLEILIKKKKHVKYIKISEISFICTCFLKKKIIEKKLINKLFSILCCKITSFSPDPLQKGHVSTEVVSGDNWPLPIDDILILLHFIYFYNLKFDDLYKYLLIICLNKLLHMNDAQQLMVFNCVEGMRKRKNSDYEKPLLDYFMYDQNVQFFLNRNKNIERESMGFLFAN
ncbi:conserved Plasmodium protein, unknown function [Plasmodium ovale]|uniref:Uncharacterized protein n=2 Tax=Plasmodium ovale TaxID=36330 RepID=A0A1A8VXV4_PLAOA|nr:conserved Plasmodium protein, unknown function [Plasmodium ovale curtisi]SBS94425.1 conserved Plasmodium protein, unknown function [Plasmodium ovale curtisi]SCP05072.1 conserved Plasmodium protein, unknown function [Plasmodium ovale]